jgi:hypothetical protein
MFAAIINPATNCQSYCQAQCCAQHGQGITPFLVGLASGIIIGVVLGWWGYFLTCRREASNRILAGRDRFHDVTADMRAEQTECKDKPEVFIEKSVPILRQAVYRVERFAKDWPSLQAAWKEYEARDKKDGKLTAFSCLVDDTEALHGAGKSAFDIHSDYLKRFDDYVG